MKLTEQQRARFKALFHPDDIAWLKSTILENADKVVLDEDTVEYLAFNTGMAVLYPDLQ